jgi:hypothetical protein
MRGRISVVLSRERVHVKRLICFTVSTLSDSTKWPMPNKSAATQNTKIEVIHQHSCNGCNSHSAKPVQTPGKSFFRLDDEAALGTAIYCPECATVNPTETLRKMGSE